ncbi:MAG: hypothetical protein HGA19_05510 [Oscillochloris sp.]|nr:hypothetical protein [Oscillochloris sp.]
MNTSQPHRNSVPDSDLELLSGYIDDLLDAPIRVTLERRLSVEPQLRATLEDLRSTVTVLRNLEALPPPRSFTLDPATAPRRRPFLPLAWVMQLSGGLAGLVLVLIASLQMLGGMNAGVATTPMMYSEVMQDAPPAPASSGFDATRGGASPTMTPVVESALLATVAESQQAVTDSPMPAAALIAPTATAAMLQSVQVAPDAAQATAAREMAATGSMAPGTGAEDTTSAANMAAADSVPTGLSDNGLPLSGSEDMELPAAKAAAQPQPPSLLILSIGLALLGIAFGSFLYRRR